MVCVCLVLCVLLGLGGGVVHGTRSGSTCRSEVTPKKPLYILALGPYPGELSVPHIEPSWEGGPAIIPAARLAIEQINNRTDILCDYELQILEADSGCDIISKVDINFGRFVLLNEQNVVGIVGPGCSDVTVALGTLLLPERIDIVQVAVSTTVSIDGSIHRNTFRTVSSSLKFVRGFAELIRQEEWTQVAILYDSARQNHAASNMAFKNLISNTTVHSIGVSDSNIKPITAMSEVRIIFVFASQSVARNILCVAFHSEMFFPMYQFFFVVRSLEELVKYTCVEYADRSDGSCEFNCTVEDMKRVVNGSILSQHQLSRVNTNDTTVSNISFEEYDELYMMFYEDFLKELDIFDDYDLETGFHHVYYDAAWALALALNNSVPRLDEMGLDLSDYSYRSANHSIFTEVLKDELFALDFEGVSGRIRLDADARDAKDTAIRLMQVCFDCVPNISTIGFYKSELQLESGSYTFIRDRFPTSIIKIDDAAGGIMLVLTVLTAGITMCLEIATFYYRDHKSVKASSPQFTHLIFSSSYLALLATFLYLLSGTTPESFATQPVSFAVNCSAIVWCLTLGLSLLFGTVCAKAWRLYRIFTHFKQTNLRFVSDTSLISFVVFLLLVDIVLNFLWNVINPWELLVRENINDDGLLEESNICTCENLVVWVCIVGGYKILLLLSVVVLAFYSRGINRKGFEQSRYINIMVYTNLLIFGICSPIFAVYSISLPTLAAVVFALAYILSAVVTAITFFIPPLLPILKEKTGLPNFL